MGGEGRELAALVAGLRASFATGRTRSAEWRRAQLERLRDLLREREAELLAALRSDLGKGDYEGWVNELGFVLAEIAHARRNLRRWMRPRRVRTPLVIQPGTSRVVHEPLGVALILGPWNYPLNLVLAPLVAAIAAGNCAVLKPSELAPATSACLARWVPDYLDPECIAVVEGGVPETTALLEQRFDHVFFTGGERVARIVLEAAAKHLTPVTLELGGKSPCIVDRDVDLELAARRIAWGKFMNAGQTCVAPDYVLVHESREEELVGALAANVRRFYGPDPRTSPDYPRIVHTGHLRRLAALIEGEDVVLGGQHDEPELYFAPTLLRGVSPQAAIMQEEIFGPILPVLVWRDLEEALALVRAKPKPLSLYVFARGAATVRAVLEGTSSGSACVNDVVMQLAVPDLPFGGVGNSGMGAYHGRTGFETLSHAKAILRRGTIVDPRLRYPPYGSSKLRWMRRLLSG